MNGDLAGSAETARTPGIWSGSYLPITIANMTVIALVAYGGLSLVAALSSIVEDLGNVGMLPWVFTGYFATSAIAVVVAGPVIDAIGVRRTFRVTGIWFLLASAAAAAAPSMPMLILARVFQGFGGGLVFAVSLAAIGLGYPHELRPRAFAAQSAVFGVMGFGGPALAGLLLAFGGWRIIFLFQLPLTALALASGWKTLPTTRERPALIRTDWPGVGLLSLIIASSLVAVSQIGVRWWAASVAAIATATLVAIYWGHSGRVDAPVLARQHINRFPLRWVHLTAGLVTLIARGTENFLPLYLQTTRDRSVEFAAFALLFLVSGWTLGTQVYSRVLYNWRESHVILLGCSLMIPSLVAAGAAIAFGWPLPLLFVATVFVGMSVGLVSTSGLTLLQASSDMSEMGRVSAAHQFVRQLAAMYGIAIASAILLFVVHLEVGDVDAVRDVIAGENIALGTDTKDAIRHGLAWVYVVATTLAVGCLLIATSLVHRTARSLTPSA